MTKNKMLKKNHYDLVDVMRGCAIAMMILFHFTFDMANLKLLDIDFYHDPFWLNFRTFIVSSFTFIMGMSFYLAHQNGFKRKQFLRRLSYIFISALLVSISTYFMDVYLHNVQFIYFGILHFVVIASLLALLFRRLYWSNLGLGIGLLILNSYAHFRFFDSPYWNWLGFTTQKPLTDDYAPLIPWFGSVLIGMFFAQWAIKNRNFPLFIDWKVRGRFSRLLRYSGQHSLLIYLLHQPILIGALSLFATFIN